MDRRQRMRELIDRINVLNHQYYVLDNPTVSDGQWDELFDELLSLEAELGVVAPDSPTRRVGGAPIGAFVAHRHLSRLWSLDKAQTEGQLRQWRQRAQKLWQQARDGGAELPPIEYVLEYKLDGLTVNLTYEDGLLVQAATRGDGITGEAILEQARTIRSIPLSIPFKGRIEVRGEGLMKLSEFNKYNERAKEPLKNPRNAAAGALRNLNPAVTASRKLDAFFYNVGFIDGQPPYKTQLDMIEFLRAQGFAVSPWAEETDDIARAYTIARGVEKSRATLDFLIDGVVIKINDLATRAALGFTDRFPRGEVAFKFEAEETATTVERIDWEVGRTGKLTPIAILQPVELSGATISRATLNNYGDIQRKKVGVGARVFIRRSNDVIPEVMGSVEGEEGAPEPKPEHCPACQSGLQEIGANLFCPNTLSCRPQLVLRIAHFASRDAMDIEAFSTKSTEKLFDTLGIREIADLYRLKAEDLMKIEGFKEKKTQRLLDEIKKSKTPALSRFIYALGIPAVGRKTARDLSLRLGTIKALMDATAEELMTVEEVGAVIAENIARYFSDPNIRPHVERLLDSGIRPVPDRSAGAGPLSGNTFVLTGTLSTMTRQQASGRLAELGGSVSESVSKNTSAVIAGDAPGSKIDKAVKLGVRVLDERQLLDLLRDPVKI